MTQSNKTPGEAPKKDTASGILTLRQRLVAMGLAALAGIAISAIMWQFIGTGEQPTPSDGINRHSGVAAVGGPFSLINQDGVAVSQEDFSGKFMLIYFGYTWCPDVCPLALQFMDEALSRLPPKEAARVQPIFITLDPERDTPGVIKSYIASFHPDLVGLTGTQENIEAVTAAYKMYFRKTEPMEEGNPMSYGMDHMNIFYFMGPDGTYAAHFMSPTSPADVATKMSSHLQ